MFQINKQANYITVQPELFISEYESRLNADGFTGAYLPLTGMEASFHECLLKRTSNMYGLKYGGLDNLCIGGKITTVKGKHFSTKIYPRAATGPDMRLAVLGSRGLLGHFLEVSLRIFPLPEYECWGMALFETPEEALKLLRNMIGAFIRPLFALVLEEDEAVKVFEALGYPKDQKIALLFKLTGLKRMVEAEQESIMKPISGSEVFIHWISRPKELALIDQKIISAESYQNINKIFPFFGGDLSPTSHKNENDFEKYFKEKTC